MTTARFNFLMDQFWYCIVSWRVLVFGGQYVALLDKYVVTTCVRIFATLWAPWTHHSSLDSITYFAPPTAASSDLLKLALTKFPNSSILLFEPPCQQLAPKHLARCMRELTRIMAVAAWILGYSHHLCKTNSPRKKSITTAEFFCWDVLSTFTICMYMQL